MSSQLAFHIINIMPKLKKFALLILSFQLLAFSLLSNIARADVKSDQTTSVTVPAQASDFPISISRVTSGDTFSPGQTIEYQITYGSDLSFSVADLKIEAQWYAGTASDNSTHDVADYVVGSATYAYGDASPVIDTVNQKIDWTISNLPSNTTNQTVTFKLKTNGSYTGSSVVDFNVAARIYGPGVTTDDQTVTTSYKYPAAGSTSPTSTPTPTPIGAPTTPLGAPTTPLAINSVEVRTIAQDQAAIYVSASKDSKFSIGYGKTENLGQSVSSVTFSPEAFLTLTKLTPDTVYFFRVSATDKSGDIRTSDLFTFQTASSPPPEVNTGSLIATSNDSIISLLPDQLGKNAQIILVVPESTLFKFRFNVQNASNVKSVQAYLRNKNILGLGFPVTQALADTQISNLVELSPGVWEGSIPTGSLLGDYELYAKIKDTKGNIREQKIANVKVVNKFTVLSKNGNGIEGARVIFYVYSPTAKKYARIPSVNLSGGNPQFTDSQGKLNIVLPQGKFKATVSEIGYKDQTVYFDLGADSGFPIVKLESINITPFAILRFYGRTLNDVFLYNTQLYTQILTGSVRFFDLVAAVILGSFVVLTLMAFSKKHRIPVSSLASYFYYLIDHNGNQKSYVEGVVYDEKDNPIPGANVYLNDSETEEIISSTKTNRRGEFFFRRTASQKDKYLLLVMCKNFKTTHLIPYEAKTHVHLKITLEKEHEGLNLIENIGKVLSETLGMSFEGLAVLTFIFEILFLVNFGVIRTVPFLVVSVFNLFIWSLYIRHHHHFVN